MFHPVSQTHTASASQLRDICVTKYYSLKLKCVRTFSFFGREGRVKICKKISSPF